MQNKVIFFIGLLLLPITAYCQSEEKKEATKDTDTIIGDISVKNIYKQKAIDPLAPSKAAFYSALLPGLGQAYNKKYWKIPIIYAGLVTTGLIYDFNNTEYNRYRDAFKSRAAGLTNDEFFGVDANGNPLATPRISEDGLIRAQRQFRRNRDLSLIIAIGIYALNIIEANVNAHLLSFNVDENLALRPRVNYNYQSASADFGMSLSFKF